MNDPVFFLYFILAVLLVGVLTLLGRYAWRTNLLERLSVRRSLRRGYTLPDDDATELCIEEALRSINVDYSKHKSSEVDFVDYTFRFQNGHFVLILQKEKTRMLRILFPNIHDGSLDDIDLLRSSCNDFNSQYVGIMAFYDVDSQSKAVRIHLECSLPRMSKPEELAYMITDRLEQCFSACRSLQQYIENGLEYNRRSNSLDREYAKYRDEQWTAMIEECEAMHCGTTLLPEGHLGDGSGSPITLGAWIDTMDYLIGCDLKLLRLITPIGTVFETEDLAAIESYCLKDAVALTKDAQGNPLGCDDTTLELLFEPFAPNENPSGIKNLCALRLFFTAESLSKERDVLYVRMTHIIPQCGTLNPKAESHFDQNQHPVSGSQIIAVELQPTQSTQAEMRFMLGDAKDKLAEGKVQELTPQQRLLVRFENYDEHFLIAKGFRFLREKCYVDAVYYLSQVWDAVNIRMRTSDKAEHALLLDLSEWIGTALYKLGLYRKAFYYIDMLQMKNRPDYSMLYINCLIALKDWRALPWINDRIEDTKNQIDTLRQNDEEVPASAYKFFQFLVRRRIHVLVELDELDQAESACKELVGTSHEDFALSELAYIAELRKEKGDAKPSFTIDDEDDIPF